jgi:hypothetical protein
MNKLWYNYICIVWKVKDKSTAGGRNETKEKDRAGKAWYR